MPDRYPGYDVLAKRDTPSWNEQTRRVIERRLNTLNAPRFFTVEEFATIEAIAARILPQPETRPKIPVAALVDDRMLSGQSDGYRHAGMPREGEAWRQGLRALDEAAQQAHGAPFRTLDATRQDELLKQMEGGKLANPAWGSMSSARFFTQRMARDIVFAYYAHPTSWNEIGFGGPASPRGYVRTDFDERDPWEAAEVKNGDVDAARRKNRHV
jgi:hypothetical protein